METELDFYQRAELSKLIELLSADAIAKYFNKNHTGDNKMAVIATIEDIESLDSFSKTLIRKRG